MKAPNIFVIGDVAIKCGLAVSPAERPMKHPDHTIRLGKPQPPDGSFVRVLGGAWRIVEYLQARSLHTRRPLNVGSAPPPPNDDTSLPPEKLPPQLFVDFSQFTTKMYWEKKAKMWLPESKVLTYRVKSSIARCQAHQRFRNILATRLAEHETLEAIGKADVLVVCDRQLGFREALAKNSLSKVFENAFSTFAITEKEDSRDNSRWVVIEATDPRDEDHLALLRLLERNGLLDRTVIVVSANSLRASGITFRDDLSLERSVEDLVKTIDDTPDTEVKQMIRKMRLVVVRLGYRAALIWQPNLHDGEQGPYLLYGNEPYEPQASPAAESSDLGIMHGLSSIMAAEIAIGLSDSQKLDSELLDRVTSHVAIALNTGRRYFDRGFGATMETNPNVFQSLWKGLGIRAATQRVYHVINGDVARHHPREWAVHSCLKRKITIVDEVHVEVAEDARNPEIDIPIAVVQQGLGVLHSHGIPFVEHVELSTADRHEIENYAGIASLVTKYMDDATWSKPLCLGVFGPPGCGKSFGIEQVIQAITGYKTKIIVSKITVNLSQLTRADELALALHRIRNEGLAQKLPLVFVDEFDCSFDSKEYGWLKYLLAPMQDGQFLDGDTLFNLPRCILVFIGGQNRDFIEFESRLRDPSFIAAKGRDFISRLRHYLVVKGPDGTGPADSSTRSRRTTTDNSKGWDGIRLRRAMLLRSVLQRSLKIVIEREVAADGTKIDRANVDERVIEAFLSIDCYKHGVRSLEAIVDMSRASVTRRSFQTSSLPPEEQLELHVDARRFLEIMNQHLKRESTSHS